jgi:putative endonuclease
MTEFRGQEVEAWRTTRSIGCTFVASRTVTLSIGMTNNLYVRVAQHKSGEIEGFSSDRKCNRQVYWESFDEVLKAINREKQLKGGGRRRLH